MSDKFKKLYQEIDYEFSNPGLLERALTHRSLGKDNNERSEFLGDAILSYLIADWLFTNMADASEGELSRVRSYLVCGDALAELAQNINLGEYLNLGPGEMKTGGHRRVSILADAFEATIAAIYLDSNIDTCKQVVFKLMASKLNPQLLEQHTKDPKSQLQEFLQAKHLPLPEYKIKKIEGQEHAQVFYVKCVVDSLSRAAEGSGSSRRRAEQNAASALLKLITGHG